MHCAERTSSFPAVPGFLHSAPDPGQLIKDCTRRLGLEVALCLCGASRRDLWFKVLPREDSKDSECSQGRTVKAPNRLSEGLPKENYKRASTPAVGTL